MTSAPPDNPAAARKRYISSIEARYLSSITAADFAGLSADDFEELTHDCATEAAEAVTQRVVAALKKITVTLSGDDDGLENTWEEICVQVQGEESFFWDTYGEVMKDITRGELGNLPYRDLAALWLRTDDGWDWLSDVAYEAEQNTESARCSDAQHIPYDLNAIANNIHARLISIAEDDSNDNIEAYLERESGDYDDDEDENDDDDDESDNDDANRE